MHYSNEFMDAHPDWFGERTIFEVGDWVVRKDGAAFINRANLYRGRCRGKLTDTRICVDAGADYSVIPLSEELTLAPPEPTDEELGDEWEWKGEYRPVEFAEGYLVSGKREPSIAPGGISTPRYILHRREPAAEPMDEEAAKWARGHRWLFHMKIGRLMEWYDEDHLVYHTPDGPDPLQKWVPSFALSVNLSHYLEISEMKARAIIERWAEERDVRRAVEHLASLSKSATHTTSTANPNRELAMELRAMVGALKGFDGFYWIERKRIMREAADVLEGIGKP